MHASTLFIGQSLIELDQVDSTNVYARQMLDTSTARPIEGTVVFTHYQYSGKGQRGTTWSSQAGKNIMMSLILYPETLAAREQFYLSMAMALGVLDLMKCIVAEQTDLDATKLHVKWPNDLYHENHKLGGILIENSLRKESIQTSIVGIGINLNQVDFASELSQATSVRRITGHDVDVKSAMQQAFRFLEARYLQVKARKFDNIKTDYLAALYRFNEEHDYYTIDGVVNGRITGVDADGKLEVLVAEKHRYYDLKEIRFLI